MGGSLEGEGHHWGVEGEQYWEEGGLKVAVVDSHSLVETTYPGSVTPFHQDNLRKINLPVTSA